MLIAIKDIKIKNKLIENGHQDIIDSIRYFIMAMESYKKGNKVWLVNIV